MGTIQFSDFLSPAGALAAAVGFLIGLLLLKDLRNARFLLSIILAFGAMGMVDDTLDTRHGQVAKNFLAPLVTLRQPLFLAMGMVLLLGALAHLGKLSPKRISGGSYALVLVGCFVGLMQFYHAGAVDGVASIAIAIITLGVPALVVPSMLDDYEDFMRCVRTIAYAGLIWNFCVFMQFGINSSALTLGASRRFMGVAANPQHAACFLAIVGICSLFLSLNESHQRFRLMWIAQSALCAAFIGWAGSRTGVVMFGIGAAAILYRRLGRAVLFLPVIIVVIGLAINVIQSFQFTVQAERLVSTEDTRSIVWRNMIETGMANPIMGAGTRNAGGSENSFLLAFASFGAGGLICAMLLVAVVVWQSFQLMKIRSIFDPAAGRLVDLQIGLFGAFFAGAMFEGYLVARISAMTVMFVLFASMASRLLAIARQSQLAQAHGSHDEYADAGPSSEPASA